MNYSGKLAGATGNFNQDVYYVSPPVGYNQTLNITINIQSGSSWAIIYKKDSFPYYTSNTETNSYVNGYVFAGDAILSMNTSIYLRAEDLYEGGTHYISVANFNTTALKYTLR